MVHRSWKLHVSPRLRAGPQATHPGSTVAGHDWLIQDAFECVGWKPRAPRVAEDSGEGGQGNAVLHEGLRSDANG